MAEGDIRLCLIGAKGLERKSIFGKKPDPFAVVLLGDDEVGRTSLCKRTSDPLWSEFMEISLMGTEDSSLIVDIYDGNGCDSVQIDMSQKGSESGKLFRTTSMLALNSAGST